MSTATRGRRATRGGGWQAAGVLELVYTGLLALSSLLIGWFTFYVLYKLYEGQR